MDKFGRHDESDALPAARVTTNTDAMNYKGTAVIEKICENVVKRRVCLFEIVAVSGSISSAVSL